MALSTQAVTRRLNFHAAVIALSLTGATLAIVPIVAGIVGGLLGGSTARTAFADAPAGEYAVYVSAGEREDTIFVASPDNVAAPLEVGTVAHLAGFPVRGTVSPDGRRLALTVVDAGTAANPGASLQVLDLETGTLERIALNVDHLQLPLWTPDGAAIVVTRGGDAAPGRIGVASVRYDGSWEKPLLDVSAALGVFPVGFDPDGRFLAVLEDGRGSSLVRDGTELQTFAANGTRDWALSPDGRQLAFIETVFDGGVRYEPRVIAVEPVEASSAQTLADGAQALGAAWAPGAASPTFGLEAPGTAGIPGTASAQRLEEGFDIPLGFSASGDASAVRHWSGNGFDNPGDASIQLGVGSARFELTGATGFLGWAVR